MKKKILLNLTWGMLPMMAFADLKFVGNEFVYDEHFYTEDHAYIYNEFVYVDKANYTGYTIIPAAEIRGKEKEGHTTFQNEKKEMLKNGYAYSPIEDPQEIFSIQYRTSSEYPFLQPKLSDIELAFSYTGLDFVEEKNNLGYYSLWKYQDGWFAIGQYFRDPKLGMCNYERINLSLDSVNVRIIAEDLSYEINQKPTRVVVKGSDEVGYFAYLDWYDHTCKHHLQCGVEKFDANYLSQAMALAIKIDQVK
jgi:hypothetical protein